jgi:DNA recombination protein RmuC
MTAVGFALALGVGSVAFCLGWLFAASRAARREAGLQDLLRTESARSAGLEAERRAADEKARSLDQMTAQLQEAFKSLSGDALRSNIDEFLRIASLKMEKQQESARGDLDQRHKAIADLVGPVRESLDKVLGNVQDLEKSRVGAYAALWQQVKSLHSETKSLATALRAPGPRGRWAELHLRRVVELTGLTEHCDFDEQVTVTADGSALRPDMVIRMPAGRVVLVDAKAPMAAYLDAAEAPDEATRTARLRDHAAQVRQHVVQLARKAYWERFDQCPEFIVMYVPSEALFAAAQEHDRDLLEWALSQRVILATPATLFALLHTVARGWKQEKIELNARDIANLGRELHKRVSDAAAHLGKLGRQIEGTVRAYNDAVGSLERRVLPAARRFGDLQASHADVEIEALTEVENVPRRLTAAELLDREVPEDAN